MCFRHACEELRSTVIISGGRDVKGFVVIFSSFNTTTFIFCGYLYSGILL